MWQLLEYDCKNHRRPRQKIDKSDHIKLLFCASEDTINRGKGNIWSGRRYVQIIWRILKNYNFNNNKNKLSKKWAKDLNKHFSIDDIQKTNNHMKRFSTSLVNREMHIRTMRCHQIPTSMATTKTENKKLWW